MPFRTRNLLWVARLLKSSLSFLRGRTFPETPLWTPWFPSPHAAAISGFPFHIVYRISFMLRVLMLPLRKTGSSFCIFDSSNKRKRLDPNRILLGKVCSLFHLADEAICLSDIVYDQNSVSDSPVCSGQSGIVQSSSLPQCRNISDNCPPILSLRPFSFLSRVAFLAVVYCSS